MLIADETFTAIPFTFTDFVDTSSPYFTVKLLGQTKIHNDLIDLVDSQRPYHRPIYSLGPMESDILKTYFDTNLTICNGFIKHFKLVTDAPKGQTFYRCRYLHQLTPVDSLK